MRAALVLGIVVGCGGDAPTPPVDAADLDATVGACAVAGDCPCFSNYDCPAATACTSLDDSGTQVWCLPGPRGAGAAGDACTGEADCATSLCVDALGGGLACSDRCLLPSDCPANLPACVFIGFGIDEMICAPSGS